MTLTIERRRIGALRVAAVEIPGLRSVTSLLALPAGQWFEPSGRAGVARLTAQTMLRGTLARDVNAWSDALDAIGATGRLDVGGHAAAFAGQCLSQDLATYLELVSETVLRPSLADVGLEFTRAQTLAELEEDAKDTRAVADSTWRELAYPALHPFRTRPLGVAPVVRDASIEELRAFHRDRVLAGGGNLVLAGGGSTEAMFEAVSRAFAAWAGVEVALRPAPPVPAIAAAMRRDVVIPDKTQCDVVIGWHGLPRRDPRFVTARVANMVFGADTFASRAGHVVRDQLGLAYYVVSTLGASIAQAPWTVRMGVNPENVERAIQTTLDELRKITTGDVADDDVALAKDKLVGELDVALESPGGVASLVLEGELFELGDDALDRYPAELRRVTRDEVVAIAREFLPPDRYAMAVAGPPLRG